MNRQLSQQLSDAHAKLLALAGDSADRYGKLMMAREAAQGGGDYSMMDRQQLVESAPNDGVEETVEAYFNGFSPGKRG